MTMRRDVFTRYYLSNLKSASNISPINGINGNGEGGSATSVNTNSNVSVGDNDPRAFKYVMICLGGCHSVCGVRIPYLVVH